MHVFLCLDENSRAAEVALRLQEALAGRPNVNLLPRIKSHTSLQSILDMAADRSPRLVSFGRVEDACCDQAFRHEYNEEIALLAELEHRRWNAERWLAGWRYGTPSSKAKRTNEYLVPWNELDPSIQKYDREAVMSIPARLKLAKPPMKVVRKSRT
jgi:hypothetical protein